MVTIVTLTDGRVVRIVWDWAEIGGSLIGWSIHEPLMNRISGDLYLVKILYM